MTIFRPSAFYLIFSFLSVSSSLAADWPRFLGPAGTGKSTETNLIGKWPSEGPKRLWKQDIGTGYSAPSIIGDQLVLHHRRKNQEIIQAFSARAGTSEWQHAYSTSFVDPFGYNNGPRCSPLLTATRCYTFGAEGKLVCLDRASGKLVWSRNTAAEFNIPQAFFGVGSTPLLTNDRLIVMIGGQPNSGIAAFHPETGETIWTSVGKDTWNGSPKTGWRGEPPVIWKDYAMQASYASPVAATIHGQQHLLCFTRQGLVSLNPEDGALRFKFWFRSRVNESVNAINPVVKDDLIFLSAAYYGIGSVLLQVQENGRSARELWRDDVLEIHWSTPILHDGYLYAFSGRNEPDARFRCVEFETGRLMWDRDERWRKSLTPPNVFGRGSLIMADQKLFALGEAGLLGIIEPTPDSLVERARFQVPELKYPCWAAPIISNKRLYLRSENRLICYDLAANQ